MRTLNLALLSLIACAPVQAADLDVVTLRGHMEPQAEMTPQAESSPSLLGGWIKTNPDYAERMLDWQKDVGNKALIALRGRQDDSLTTGSLYLSGAATINMCFEHTNIAGKYPLLGRLPPQHGNGTWGSQGMIANSGLALTYAPTDWLTLFGQLEYTDLAYPSQPNVRFTKHYAVLGDLKRSPVYAKFGRDWVDFGHMDSYTPYTHTTVTHYFWAVSTNPVLMLGYAQDGWDVSATGVFGERQQRVLDAPANNGMMPNFVLNASKETRIGEFRIKGGASYAHGTIYNSDPTHHTAPDAASLNKIYNPAVDGYVEVGYGAFDVKAEYASTLRNWPASNAKVEAMSLQGRYKTTAFERPMTYSASCAKGIQAPSNSPAYQMTQCVVGAELKANRRLSIGAEYIYNDGFVPLVRMMQTADPKVKSHTLLLGMKGWF